MTLRSSRPYRSRLERGTWAHSRVSRAATDWRALALAAIVAATPFQPTFALRMGAVLAAGIALTTRFRLRLADALAIAYTSWTSLSLLWAHDGPATQLAAVNQIGVLAIFVAIRVVATTRRSVTVIATGYLFGATYSVFLLVSQNREATFVAELSTIRYGIGNLNFNYLSYALVTGLTVVILLWRTSYQKRALRLLLLCLVPLFAFGLLQSGSRGGALGALLLIAWVALWRWSPGRGVQLPVLLLMGGGALALTPILDGWLQSVDLSLTRSTGDLAGRLTIWPYARDVVAESPFIGSGAGGFRMLNPFGIGTHNIVLETVSGLGLVGLVLLAAFAYQAIVVETRYADPHSRALVIGGYIMASTPILLSGHWEYSPAGWAALALFSRIHLLATSETNDPPSDDGSTRAYNRDRT